MSRENLKLLLVAVFCIAVGMAGPAVGHGVNHALFAHNSDKVDGRHAVSPTASKSWRAGKLVATDANGLLPNDIIAKALDADRLDGLDSTAFLRSTGVAADADKVDGLDSSLLQRRVAGACGYGTAMTGVLADGQVGCANFLPSNGTAVDSAAVGGRSVQEIRQLVATESAVGTFEQPFIISPTSPTQLVEVSLTVPRAGTVQVDAVTALFINKPNTSSSWANVGVRLSTQGTDFDHPGSAYWNLSAGTPAGFYADTFPTTRTFAVGMGTHTFQVMAQGTDPTRLRSVVVNATFTPS